MTQMHYLVAEPDGPAMEGVTMAMHPKNTVEDNLACLERDVTRLLAWVANERRLTEPLRFDYLDVLEGMLGDIAGLRALLAAPERAMQHRDGDDVDVLAAGG